MLVAGFGLGIFVYGTFVKKGNQEPEPNDKDVSVSSEAAEDGACKRKLSKTSYLEEDSEWKFKIPYLVSLHIIRRLKDSFLEKDIVNKQYPSRMVYKKKYIFYNL